MPEFRYQGSSPSGKTVQGFLSVKDRREARARAVEICRRQRLQLRSLHQKANFLYKVQRQGEKPIRGEMTAFSKEEAEEGLRKLNYQVLGVQKKWFDFKFKPPTKDIVLFIRLCADLLRERLPFDEILELLSTDTENKVLQKTIGEIQHDLKEGKDGQAVFGKHADVLGRFPAYMLGVASTSGNMAEVYESTAKFMERDEEFRKSLKSALIMPSVIMLVLIGAVFYYVGYIFPATAKLFVRLNIDLENQAPMTYYTLILSEFMQANIWWLVPAFLLPLIGLAAFLRTEKGRYLKDRFIIKIPVVGSLLHKTSIEIFSRVFYVLYSGSGENINVIRVAAEACRNSYMERQIKELAIPQMLKDGKGLVESLEATGVFTRTAVSRFRSGQESGALRTTALQLANYYEQETSYRLKNIIELINIIIALVIMVVMTALTLVSSETATINPGSRWSR